ncbi:MAG: WG repeat-containing protein [Pirellulaceae bacterium]|nr:WG repeat-containing protein [Pirellulaceae bacterium]
MVVDMHLYPVRFSSHQWGFIDHTGVVKIPGKFRYASDFREGIAIVKTQKRSTGGIDINGQLLFDVRNVETNSSFSDGLLECTNVDGRSGFLDIDGNLAITFSFDEALDFSQRVAPAQVDGHWGAIDRTGHWQIQPSFEQIMKWGDGQYSAAQLKDFSWVIIDKRGVRQTNKTFGQVYPQLNGYIVVRHQSQKWALLDSKLRPCWEKDLSNIDDGVIEGTLAAAKNDLWGVLGVNGNWTLPPQFTNVTSIVEGFRRFYVGGSRDDNYALAGGKYGYLDETNQIAIPAIYADAREFKHGLAKVSFYCDDDPNGLDWYAHWGYIDRFGKLVWSNRK